MARITDALEFASRTMRTEIELDDPAEIRPGSFGQATITLADEVVFLADGEIVARGSHEDLQRRVPGYAALVQAYDTVDAAHDELVGAEEVSNA